MRAGDCIQGRPVRAAVEAALRRARSLALSTRRSDGSWCFPADVGPVSTAQALIALHSTGLLDATLAARLGRSLRAQQRVDGSFLRYVQAEEGDLSTTAVCASALERAGEGVAAIRAFAYVASRGGLDRVVEALASGELAVAFLVAAGTLPPAVLGRHGVEVFAVPGFEKAFLRRYHAGALMVFAQLAFLARGGDPQGFLMAPALATATRLCADFQNEDGGYNSFTMPTALAACAWMALGTPEGRERGLRAGRWLLGRVMEEGGEARVYGFQLPVWSTTFHLRALLYAGEPVENLVASIDWLCDAQQRRPQQWRNNPQGAVATGGWAFDPENHTMPDNADTGAVLAVLRQAHALLPAHHPLQARILEAHTQGRAWLLGMQNADGGWASYTCGLPAKPSGPAMTRSFLAGPSWSERLRLWFRPPLHLGDPSTEDVTARVLHGLHLEGAARERALQFLQRQQCADGSFWGRWLMNHLAGTTFVLIAMEGARPPWVERAIAWVLERQNQDGSWGETPASYRDPALAGRGPGMAPLTGLVVNGLLSAGEDAAAMRGLQFLLDREKPGGGWEEDGWLTPLLLPDTFYAHPQAALYYPLEALGRMAGRLR